MQNIIVENVRCFVKTGPIPLKPLTFLLGENSTGKSTFLALTRLTWDMLHRRGLLDFNEEPFALGGFNQLAHFRKGKVGRAKSFKLGATINYDWQRASKRSRPGRIDEAVQALMPGRKFDVNISATFHDGGLEPTIDEIEVSFGSFYLSVTSLKSNHVNIKITGPEIDFSRLIVLSSPILDQGSRYSLRDFTYVLYHLERTILDGSEESNDASKIFLICKLFEHVIEECIFPRSRRPYAFAPVRTHPERTYNPITDIARPSGDHIPVFLARMRKENPEAWDKMKSYLENYGRAAGLFKNLEIRSLGRHSSDPFQLEVCVSGPKINLKDVGYGVSQVLPIIVDTFNPDSGNMFLLQQPEVHLHPRGQAELGTMLCRLVSESKKQFIVETHSDYMIDRVRLEIRDNKFSGLKCDDVCILFFAWNGLEVKIHTINIDPMGNLVNVPENYRSFFLSEERRLFGI